MKKSLCLLLTAFMAIGLAACGAPTATTTQSVVATAVPTVVTFADPELEAMLRGAMGKPVGDITPAEAQAVTTMNLNNKLQRYMTAAAVINDVSGLEGFTNLESLDLSDQAITDISPLEGLTKLTSLSLAGNPVTDLSPLASLTNLKLLILSGSQAQDYSALANLVNLQVLLLDNSTITDLSPLTALTNLRALYLANTPADDYSPLETLYPNLEKKDFIIPSTLVDLGFGMDSADHMANFDSENAAFTINHAAWGVPSREDNMDIIRMSTYLEGDYKLSVGYYGVHHAYVCQMDKEGQPPMNYVYDVATGSFNIGAEDRPNAEQMIRAAMDVVEGEDVLLAPVRFFDNAIKNTFHMTAEKLFALPYEPPTLTNLGFRPDQANAVYLFEQRGEKVVNMEVHRPEWGEKDFDVRFFTPLSDEYRIVVTWHAAERKFIASVDDNSQGGANFEFFIDTGEHLDGWCSYKDKTVEQYFIKAYNDPEIEDIYQHSVELMVQYISDTFGLTIEELYALPTGE
jgi:hypothetical protein